MCNWNCLFVGFMGLVFLVLWTVHFLIFLSCFFFFWQDGKHGKAWGIVHKEGECIYLLPMFLLILVPRRNEF